MKRPASIHLFTLIQLTLLGTTYDLLLTAYYLLLATYYTTYHLRTTYPLGLCWAINLSPFGLFVSFLIVSLVPAREYLLPGLFSAAELALLDPVEPAVPDDAVPDAADDQFDEEELEEELGHLELASSVHGAGVVRPTRPARSNS